LKGIGITSPTQITQLGGQLIQMQMFGMLVGGLFWGILGDKKGRLSVLFGSILLYSLSNIANGFVQDFNQYQILRFIAGIGLAGELGAGITLVSEIMSKEKRGYGTMIVACVGACGAILAHLVAENVGWRYCYYIGGALGMLLLILRVSVFESGMFAMVKKSPVEKGNFFMFFTNWVRFKKYLFVILIGIPVWYTVGILITFSPELAKDMGIHPTIESAGKSVMFSYIGLVVGDLIGGTLSQVLKTRKKVIFGFLVSALIISMVYLSLKNVNADVFYFWNFMAGAGTGYWVLFCSTAAEQFGTNIRATAATTVPNFVRGSVVPMVALFQYFKTLTNSTVDSARILGIICIVIALAAVFGLQETFAKDLNYLEE
jgi:MFS family permease